MFTSIENQIISLGLSPAMGKAITLFLAVSALGAMSWIIDFFTKRYLVDRVRSLISRVKPSWVQILLDNKLVQRVSHFAPGLFLYFTSPFLKSFGPQGVQIAQVLHVVVSLYLLGTFTLVLNTLLNIGTRIYETYEIAIRNPIRSYVQVIKIILYVVSIVVGISLVLDKSPMLFFTGLGAATAVIMLVFKDTILGFVASVQLTSYDMVRMGDWISVPSFNADGDVEEISLSTVKIRNFDKTISTIPTASLLTHGVKNWRGMKEAGGRRIKRSIHIDMNTITFCTPEIMKEISKIDILSPFLKDREQEIESHNRAHVKNESPQVNGRALTNVGLYRYYINEYLRNNQHIHQTGFTFLIRQLQPTQTGLPIEIYVFTKDTNWVNHEHVQADIFDHLFASLPLFQLRAFQNDTGHNPTVILNGAPVKTSPVKEMHLTKAS
jgi:miniconductance mechanosensitive channel